MSKFPKISGSESFTRWLAPFAPFAADGRGHVRGRPRTGAADSHGRGHRRGCGHVRRRLQTCPRLAPDMSKAMSKAMSKDYVPGHVQG